MSKKVKRKSKNAKSPQVKSKDVKWPKKVSRVRPFKVLTLKQFIKRKFPIPKKLLGDWLREQYLVLLYAARGVGKTHIALGIAYAVASGTEFLGWQASAPRKVIYFDGEMQAHSLRARLRRIRKATSGGKAARNLSIINPDTQHGVLPDLGTTQGQELFDRVISDDVALIIIDNLSAWCRDGRESADAWSRILPWALKHRSEGRAIIFVHHAGKNNTQRGTSKREDQVDFTIALRRPKNYKVEDDAFFEVHFEKNRQLAGDSLKPFEARYAPDKSDIWRWSRAPITVRPDPDEEQVVELLRRGEKQALIAKQTGKQPYTITRIKQKAEKEGWI